MPQAPDCIFCAIVAKRTGTKFIYEDKEFVSFLDINPIAEGHSLVVPKRHAVNLMDADPEMLGKSIRVAQKVARRLQKKLGAEGFSLFVASGEAAEQTVPHFHLHVIPRRSGEESKLQEWWGPRVRKATRDELDSLAADLSFRP